MVNGDLGMTISFKNQRTKISYIVVQCLQNNFHADYALGEGPSQTINCSKATSIGNAFNAINIAFTPPR